MTCFQKNFLNRVIVRAEFLNSIAGLVDTIPSTLTRELSKKYILFPRAFPLIQPFPKKVIT